MRLEKILQSRKYYSCCLNIYRVTDVYAYLLSVLDNIREYSGPMTSKGESASFGMRLVLGDRLDPIDFPIEKEKK